MFNKPILIDITSFDAKEDKRIDFNVSGGDLYTKVKATVTERNTPSVIFKTYETNVTSEYFILPAGILENNKYYSLTLQVGDGTTWSSSSSSDYFSCFEKAILSVDGLDDGLIEEQSYTFKGNYTQPNDPIRYYRFRIFDSEGNIFYDSGNVYDGLLSVQVAGFENEENYYLIFNTVSQAGIASSTEKIKFKVHYKRVGINSKTDIVCDTQTGDVSIKAIITNQKGEVYYGSLTDDQVYESTEEITFGKHKDNSGASSTFAELDGTKNIISFPLESVNFEEGCTITLWFYRKDVTKPVNLMKAMCNGNTVLVTIQENIVEAYCSFYDLQTIYKADIESQNNHNEVLRVTIKGAVISMEHILGGAI